MTAKVSQNGISSELRRYPLEELKKNKIMRKQRSHMDVIGSNLRQRFESKLPLFDEKAPDLRNHAHAYS